MFKLPITYLGFDGKEKTRDFYFNLTKGEIAEMNYTIPGGLDGFLNRLNDEPNADDIITTFKMLILKSYGKRTPDGRFIKSKELSEEFSATDAYSELFLKFIENADGFVDKFLEGVVNAAPGTMSKIVESHPEVSEAIEKVEKVESGDF